MQLFYSYSSKDESARLELEAHLSLLKREGVLATWSFRDIEAGQDWKTAIDRSLDTADVVLLLVTANFLASTYCMDVEMKRSIERADAGQALLLPVIVKPCDWKTAPFARFQVLPTGGKPISLWRPRDLGWADTASGIRLAVAGRENAHRDAQRVSSPRSRDAVPNIHEAATQLQRDADRTRRFNEELFDAFSRATSQLFPTLTQMATDAAAAAPSIGLTVHVADKKCVVHTSLARLEVEVGFISVTVYIWFAQQRYFKFLVPWTHIRWVPTQYRYWSLQIHPDTDDWEWSDHEDERVRIDDLPGELVKRLLNVHAAVSRGEQLQKAKNLPVSHLTMTRP